MCHVILNIIINYPTVKGKYFDSVFESFCIDAEVRRLKHDPQGISRDPF